VHEELSLIVGGKVAVGFLVTDLGIAPPETHPLLEPLLVGSSEAAEHQLLIFILLYQKMEQL
jgi:hypothetical protein